jgi:hypothetical protein
VCGPTCRLGPPVPPNRALGSATLQNGLAAVIPGTGTIRGHADKAHLDGDGPDQDHDVEAGGQSVGETRRTHRSANHANSRGPGSSLLRIPAPSLVVSVRAPDRSGDARDKRPRMVRVDHARPRRRGGPRGKRCESSSVFNNLVEDAGRKFCPGGDAFSTMRRQRCDPCPWPGPWRTGDVEAATVPHHERVLRSPCDGSSRPLVRPRSNDVGPVSRNVRRFFGCTRPRH